MKNRTVSMKLLASFILVLYAIEEKDNDINIHIDQVKEVYFMLLSYCIPIAFEIMSAQSIIPSLFSLDWLYI